jgi:hypothetical protein
MAYLWTGHLGEERGSELMLVRVFALTDILLGLFIERLLAARRAEVIGCTLVFGLASRGRRINIHATHGVFDCICHIFSPSLLIITE